MAVTRQWLDAQNRRQCDLAHWTWLRHERQRLVDFAESLNAPCEEQFFAFFADAAVLQQVLRNLSELDAAALSCCCRSLAVQSLHSGQQNAELKQSFTMIYWLYSYQMDTRLRRFLLWLQKRPLPYAWSLRFAEIEQRLHYISLVTKTYEWEKPYGLLSY